jgi:hypothetical protein
MQPNVQMPPQPSRLPQATPAQLGVQGIGPTPLSVVRPASAPTSTSGTPPLSATPSLSAATPTSAGAFPVSAADGAPTTTASAPVTVRVIWSASTAPQ